MFDSLSNIFPPNLQIFATNADVYSAIAAIVGAIWVDSVCGDGVCDFNTVEYPAFGASTTPLLLALLLTLLPAPTLLRQSGVPPLALYQHRSGLSRWSPAVARNL